MDWNNDMESCPLDEKVCLLSSDTSFLLPQKENIGTITFNGRFKTKGECYKGNPDYFYRSAIVAWKPYKEESMNRLTSDKDVNDMGMVELAYNACYGKDGRARYRDYDSDVDARELAIQLLERYADIPNEFTCDDDFDEAIIGYMSYGIENPEGLIALFYRNLWAMADLRGRLKKYEDTNLTPEKILELDKMYQKLSREVMEYRKAGTIEECKEAVEKQGAKKTLGKQEMGKFQIGECPCCNMPETSLAGYCGSCGQKLDWGGEE